MKGKGRKRRERETQQPKHPRKEKSREGGEERVGKGKEGEKSTSGCGVVGLWCVPRLHAFRLGYGPSGWAMVRPVGL